MENHHRGEEDVIAKSEILKFKQFDIISTTDANHHDLFSKTHNLSSNHDQLSQKATAYIMREWNILKDSLPSFIYVRAYEDKIDLLTAVIIGRAGSPFHQGLFIFDIQFTSDYPYSPPKIFRRYSSGHLNPSLNPGGVVCHTPLVPLTRSLPTMTYSILGILMSLRVNLITSKPAPTYRGRLVLPTYWGYWMEKEYLSFDQDMFLLNCQTILAVLNKPPKHLEEFVVQHFRQHAESILITCKNYVDLSLPKVDDARNMDEYPKEEWENYRISMRGTYVELVKAFIKNGSHISLENYVSVGDHNNVSDTDDDDLVDTKTEHDVADSDDDAVDTKKSKHGNLGFWLKFRQCWRS